MDSSAPLPQQAGAAHAWWAAGEHVLGVVAPSMTLGSNGSVQAEAAALCDLEFELARVSLPFLVLSFVLEFAIAHLHDARIRRTRPHLVLRSPGNDSHSPSPSPGRSGERAAAADPVYRASSTIDSLGLATLNSLLDTFTKAIGILPYTWLWAHFRVITIQDSWLSWCVVFLLVDFCYYWMHRRAHEWNWSWAAHSVHHGSEDFNLTVGVRQGVLQQLASWMFYLPLSVLGVSPRLYHTHLMIHSIYQFYMHTKLVPKLGPLEKIFNTPSQHRVHHGRNPYCIDKNYGGTLCVWDRMFGTFAEENVNEGDEPVKYGLVHPADSLEPIWQNVMHWLTMHQTVDGVKSVFGKLQVLWRPPSWRPDGPPVKAPPTVGHPAVRYDPPMSRSLTVYCVVQSLLVWYPAAALASSSAALHEYALVSLAAIAVATVCGLSCIGMLMSGAARAWDLERARLLFMLAALDFSLLAGDMSSSSSSSSSSASWSLASWWGSEAAVRATREYAALWPDTVRGVLLPVLLLSTAYAICIGPAAHGQHVHAAVSRKLH